MTEKTLLNYVFFLKSGEQLGPSYFQLADLFNQLSIVLLPVTPMELQNLDRHKKHKIIVVRNDLQSAQNFAEIKKSYLDFSMSRGHATVYDISSFSEIENASKYQNKKSYIHFPLPVEMKQVVMSIALDYFNTKNDVEEWPGGRRSKIPTVPLA
jgi:hypothetical protein